MDQIKQKQENQMQIIILDDKESLINMIMSQYFYDFYEARPERQKYFRSFFGSNENFKNCFQN